jgi:hypothetical protein
MLTQLGVSSPKPMNVMKYYSFLLFFSIIQYCIAQPVSTQNPYTKSKEIIRDYNKIVTPNGIQESYALTIGGVKQ